ncbi:ribonuclease Y [Candidatus Gottesmanbacteria bacterium RIFCSPHIGHO2_01_FULL_39_10]|uniref:Ribonuclease Y n=1 Tax=Candidatus Gottesmanbacteria bacterium RIFCSPHIGHO2_01_FULL_39_10 TaxID=1798375 RepID=A0A1F5ZSX7_9BACT|nr:MAG: ribonuclease Y [Candidatus Gottesmanbacteria bacterium RIFCSPHIGHO2_01_FULL_39_10]
MNNQKILGDAQVEARNIIVEAKDEALRLKREAEEEARKLRQEIISIEQRVLQKEDSIDARLGTIEKRDKDLLRREQDIQKRVEDIDRVKQELLVKLEKVAHLTKTEARDLILRALEEKLKEEMAKRIRETETNIKLEATKKTREILIDAMRHGATDYVSEYTVSTIKLPDDDFKGRIIGKEGRNIRAFEMATGVDVDLDEEGVIRFSSFDPVRREIAKKSLEILMKDGRIQPVRIEEVVHLTRKDIEKVMFEEGEKLCHAVGVYNMPHDKIALLGRFKYRFSYGQNMIAHTLEETKIGIALAHELGADVNVVRLGCLLHDIGKVITDKEGSHVVLGVELLKKNGMPQSVIDCVASHHEDIPFPSLEAVIVYVADAISGARPGARYENYDEYVKRLKDLEGIATSHPGVEKAYALQAGREIRVIVDPGKLDDAASTVLAHKIKEEIESKFPTFPGQIKITIIREFRTIETVH